MKKTTLFIVAMLTMTGILFAQAILLEENFANSTFPPVGWKLENNYTYETVTPAWERYTGGMPYSIPGYILSNSRLSYNGNAIFFKANNWIFTRAIEIPDTENDVIFSYYRRATEGADELSVYIGTTQNGATMLAENNRLEYYNPVVGDGTIPWGQFRTSLNAYRGKTVYIGFHHHGEGKRSINVDDIVVAMGLAQDLVVTDFRVNNPVVNKGVNPGISIIVKNNGYQRSAAFAVELHEVDNPDVLTRVTTPSLDINQSRTINLAWSPTMVKNHELYAKVVMEGDQDETTNTTRILDIACTQSPVDVVRTIEGYSAGLSSHTTSPFNYNARNAVSQTIYHYRENPTTPNTELTGGPGLITHILYNYRGNGLPKNVPVEIWMGPTTREDFGTGLASNSDFIPLTNHVRVYNGPLNLPENAASSNNTAVWILIPLDTPYYFDARSNLVVTNFRLLTSEFFLANPGNSDWVIKAVGSRRTTAKQDQNIEINASNLTTSGGAILTRESLPLTRFIIHRGEAVLLQGRTLTDEGAIVPNAKIIRNDNPNLKAFSDDNGHYVFNHFHKLNHGVTATAPGQRRVYIPEIKVSNPDNDIWNYDIIFGLEKEVFVTGTIRKGYNLEGLSSAKVKLVLPDGEEFTGVLDEHGGFTITVVEKQIYNLVVEHNDFETYEKEVVVGAIDTIPNATIALGNIDLWEIFRPAKSLITTLREDAAKPTVHLDWFGVNLLPTPISHSLPFQGDIFTYPQKSVTVAQRFRGRQLLEYGIDANSEHVIYQVGFVPNQVGKDATYTIAIYNNNNLEPEPNDPGELIYFQDVHHTFLTKKQEWHYIDLEQRIPIDNGGEYWIAITITNERSNSSIDVPIDMGPCREFYGNLINHNGVWRAAHEVNVEWSRNWCIMANTISTKNSSPSRALSGYEIYRTYLHDMEDETKWERAAYVTTVGTTDNDIENSNINLTGLPWRYVIKAVYNRSGNNPFFGASVPIFSNIISAGELIPVTVTIKVTNQDNEPLTDAKIVMTRRDMQDTLYDTFIHTGAGNYTHTDIKFGLYNINISHEGFLSHEEQMIINKNTHLDVAMNTGEIIFSEDFEIDPQNPVFPPTDWYNFDVDNDIYVWQSSALNSELEIRNEELKRGGNASTSVIASEAWQSRSGHGKHKTNNSANINNSEFRIPNSELKRGGGAAGIYSESYCFNKGECLFPDNWIISPLMDLPDNSELVLSFAISSATRDSVENEENLSVYVIFESAEFENVVDFRNMLRPNTSHDFVDWDYEELEDQYGEKLRDIKHTSVNWTPYTIKLTDYAGSKVRIGFRHWKSTDNYYLKLGEVKIAYATRLANVYGRVMANETTPITGATVKYTSGDFVNTAITPNTGLFLITDRRIGEFYTITINADGFDEKVIEGNVGEHNDLSDIRMDLSPTDVYGTVVREDNEEPITNVAVTYVSGEFTHTFTTLANGNFVFNNRIQNETYKITFTLKGFETKVIEGAVLRENNLGKIALKKDISDVDITSIPMMTTLGGNYPNPFNPTTTIQFGIRNSELGINGTYVTIDVFNIRGQKVRTLVDGYFTPGNHSVVWNGTDDSGRDVGSGIYLYRMSTPDYKAVRKMILIK